MASLGPTDDCHDDRKNLKQNILEAIFDDISEGFKLHFCSFWDYRMQSARRTITSGNRVREVDIYSGFNKNVVNLYEENEDEAYQNALKVSSYGKRNTTPKTNWVSDAIIECHVGIWANIAI